MNGGILEGLGKMFRVGILRIFTLEHFILFFIYMGFAIFVLAKNYRGRLHRRFFIFLVLVALVSLFEFLLRQSRDFKEASFWAKFLFFWPFVFASLIDLVVTFSGFQRSLGARVFLAITYGFSLVVSFVYLFSNFLFKGPLLMPWGWEIETRAVIPIVIVYLVFIVLVAISSAMLYSAYRREKASESRKKFFYVALGILFPILVEVVYLSIYHTIGDRGYKVITEPFLVSVIVIAIAIKQEEVFRISPERYIGRVVSSIDLILVMVDTKGRIRWVNRKTCDFLGYREDELLKLNLSDILPLKGQGPEIILFSNPFVVKEVSNREFLFRTRDGEDLPVQVTSLNIKDMAGNIVGYVITGLDLSGQKKLEKKYRLEELKFKTLFEFSPDATIITDRAGNIVEVNSSVERIFNLSREALIGKNLVKLPSFSNYHSDGIRGILEENRKGEIVGPRELVIEREDGKQIFLEISARLFYAENDKLRIIVIRDITDKKAKELGLVDAITMLSAYKEAIDQFALFVEGDSMGIIRDVNDKFCSTFGFKREEIVNHHMKELSTGDIEKSVYESLRVSLRNNRIWNGIMKFVRRDGSAIYLNVFAEPFFKRGKLSGFWFFGFDVTELQGLIEKTKRLEAAKTVFLANMSHELRTPLNGVLGFIDLLSNTDLTEEQAEYIANIKNSAQSLLEIISDILDFSKIERGKLELEYGEFNLSDMAKSVMDIFVPRAEKKRINLLLYVDPGINYTVIGDPLRIKQVLINFISNAIKFTDSGGCILFELNIKRDDRDYYELTFSVSDTGIGIPRDKTDLLFNEFYQVDGTVSKGYGGSGLGLSISNNLVRMMGGEIKVESEYGKGSKFYFDIVLKKKNPLGRSIENYKFEGLRVAFLYSIEKLSFSNLTRYFTFMGCRVEVFTDIDELLVDWNRRGNYDLAVLCCNAGDNANDIRAKLSKVKELPAVVVCSKTQIRTLENSLGGRHTVVFKPFLFEDLYRSVKGVVSGRMDMGREALSGGRALSRKGKKMRFPGKKILVAEDNEINQRLMYEILKKYGLSVSIANDGREAVEAFRGTNFDVVFMDVSMPILDGVNATAFMREIDRERGKHTPIIALTAHAVRGDMERYLNSGMDDYVSKPISIEAIERVLKRYLGEGVIEDEEETPAGGVGVVERAASKLGLERGFVRELMEKFVRNGTEIVESLREKLRIHDTAGIEELAHRLKGAASNLGLKEVAEEAEKLELAAREKEEIDYSKEIDKLHKLIEIVREEMNR